MSQDQLSNRDFLNKYHEAEPYSFGGIHQVQNHFSVNPKRLLKYCLKVIFILHLESLKDQVKLHQFELMVQTTSGRLI